MTSEPPLILIVDDNPQNIQFLGSLLSEAGYEIGLAQDGTGAVEFVDERMPDLILLDIMMPQMDGYAVCESLKANRTTSHIPIIFLTARAEVDDIVKGFELGATDYVTKPFIAAELMARVKAHLELGQLRHLLPICAGCHKVRDDRGFWHQIDIYITQHTPTTFSHGICEECAERLYGRNRSARA